jgi:hypothetical protein
MTPCNESLLETPCTAEDGVISLGLCHTMRPAMTFEWSMAHGLEKRENFRGPIVVHGVKTWWCWCRRPQKHVRWKIAKERDMYIIKRFSTKSNQNST